MASVSKILAQSTPGPNLTDAYVVPSSKGTAASIIVCNLGVFAETFRVAISVGGEADHPKQYIQYNRVIEANSSEVVSNLLLRAGDVVRIWASASEVSFNILGTETGN